MLSFFLEMTAIMFSCLITECQCGFKQIFKLSCFRYQRYSSSYCSKERLPEHDTYQHDYEIDADDLRDEDKVKLWFSMEIKIKGILIMLCLKCVSDGSPMANSKLP